MTTRILYLLPVALLLGACAKPHTIAVGSMGGTEQRLLGEIVAQHLERRLEGIQVQRQFEIGDTPILYQALLGGQIDLYPEYTGGAIAKILQEEVPRDAAVALDRTRQELARRAQIYVSRPLGFDARYAAVVRSSDTAGISTMSQAAEGSMKWRPGVSLEFQSRSDGLPNLNAYRLPLGTAIRAMQPGQLFAAITSGEVNMVVVPGTDSHLTQPEWKVLEDDRHLNTPQQAVLLVSQDRIQEYAKLQPALDELAGKLTQGTMLRLNVEVDLKERPVKEVAAEFLKGAGL